MCSSWASIESQTKNMEFIEKVNYAYKNIEYKFGIWNFFLIIIKSLFREIMKQSTYIDYLKKELHSHFHRACEQDRDNYRNQTNLVNPQTHAVNYKSVYIRDLLDFYLKDLGFTPKEFVDSLDNGRSLIDSLYSYYSSFLSDRRDFQNIFEETIRNDPKLFLLAFKECLNSHHAPYETVLKHNDNKEIIEQIKRDTEDFKKLLLLGEVHNIFPKLPKDAFYTKNTLYKNLMQEKGLLEDEAFDEKKLISLFEEASVNRRHMNFDKVINYCIFHIKDIVEKFDSPGSFNAWAATYVNNKKTSEGTTIEIVNDKQFFIWITREVNSEIKDYQSKFIDQWTNSLSFRDKLSRGYSSDLSFLSYQPHKIISFLSKFTREEKNQLMIDGMRDLDFSKSYRDFKNFITSIPLGKASPFDHAKIIEQLIDFRKDKINSDDVIADNAFFSAALNHLVTKSIKIIAQSSLSDEEKAQVKKDVLSIYANNSEIIAGLISDLQNSIICNIKNLESNWKELRLHAKELNLSSEFFKNLESVAGQKLEIYCAHQLDKTRYSVMQNTIEGITNSIVVVSALGLYSTLDNLKIIDLKIDKEIKSSYGKRSKHLDGYPSVFEIVQSTEDKGILSWVFQEKHIPLLKEQALYKNRNIVEYFSILETESKTSDSVVERIFEVIMENKSVFKELVLSKKKIMKAIKGIENDYIQTSLNFVSLDNSLATNAEPVKRISNKL
jgi:hypothetical protein